MPDSAPIQLDVKVITAQASAALSNFVGGVQRAGQQIDATFLGIEERTRDLTTLWRSLFEAALAGGIIAGLESLVEKADAAQNAMEQAANSAKNFGHSLDPGKMEAWAEKFALSQQGATAGIVGTRDAIQQFTSVGLDAAQTQRAVADAAELAAAKNMDYAQATNIVRYALTGHVDMLTRYGIISREAAKNIHTVEQAMEAIEHATEGATGKLPAGEVALGRMGTAAELLAENIGNKLAPAITSMANLVTNIATAIDHMNPKVLDAVGAFLKWGGLIATVLLLLPSVRLAIQFVGGAFESLWAIVKLNVSLVGAFITGIQDLVAWFSLYRDAVASADVVTWLFEAPVLAVVAAIALLAIGIVEAIRHWGELKTALSDFLKWLEGTFGPAVRDLFLGIALVMAGDWKDAVPVFKQYMSDIGHAWSNIVTGMKDTALGAWGAIKAGWADVKNYLSSWTSGGAASPGNSNAGIPGELFSGSIPGKGSGARRGRSSASAPGDAVNPTQYILDQDEAWVTQQIQAGFAGIAASYARGTAINDQLEANRVQKGVLQARGQLTPEKSAQLDEQAEVLKEQLAQLAVNVAKDNQQIAEAQLYSAQLAHDKKAEAEAEVKVAAANKALYEATNALTKATDDVIIAKAQEAEAWRQMYPEIAKLSDLWNNLIGISNNLGNFWSQLAQRSIAVQQALTILSNLFTLLARILDAILVPVINVVNRVLTDLANVVIDVWNVMASLLNALGIHVDYLKNINSLLGDLGQDVRPLIDIVHDLPTLKEYGAGKWGPLEPDQYGSGSLLGGLLTSTEQTPTLLQRIIGSLGLIFAIDWLTHSKFFADMSAWFSQLRAQLQQGTATATNNAEKLAEGIGLIAIGTALLSTHAQGILGFVERLAGLALLVYGVMLIIQALHTAHLAIASGQLAAATTQVGLLTAIESTLISGFSALTAAQGGFSWLAALVAAGCPAVDQIMETKERGFVLAGDLQVGDHLPADDCPHGCSWHRINAKTIRTDVIVLSTNDKEALKVNYGHRLKGLDGEWVFARILKPGDKIKGRAGDVRTIVSTEVLYRGEYASLDVEHHDYVIGSTIGHNDSAGAAAMLSDAATRMLGAVIAPIADHAISIANSPGNLGSAASGIASGARGPGGSSSSSSSTSVSQQNYIGNVNEASDLESIISALSIEALFYGRGRAYQQGYQGL